MSSDRGQPLLNMLPQGVIVLGENFKVLWHNGTVLQLLGCEEA
jgi:hypothetical protein